ncbi:MAG: hypothetical protein ACK5O9_04665, partial [Holosporales bacterium]
MSKINWYNEIANGLSQVLSPFQVEVGACLQVKDPFNRRLKSREEPTMVASLNLIHEENLIVVESLRTTQLYQGLALLHNPPLLFNFRKQYDCDELSLEHCPGYAARLTERGIPRLVSLFMA